MHEEQHLALLPLLIVSLLAFAVPLVLKRVRSVRIPIAVGEILAGMLVGRSGLNLVHADSTLQLLNFLGLVSLMFVSGLEIDFEALTGKGKQSHSRTWRDKLYHPLALSLLFLGFTLAGGYLFAVRLQEQGFVRSAWLLALIIGTAALSMAVPVLKEAGLLSTKFGQTLLTGAVVGDFVTMVALTVGVSLYTGGFSIQTLLVLGLLGALLLLYRLGRYLTRFELLEGLAGGTAQIGVRASFAAMLLFVALAQSLGVEVVLGAFLAGTLMSLLSGHRREEISHKLDALGFGFLIPIFFLMVGITFDIRVLLGDPRALLFVPILLGVTLLVRGLPPALLFLLFHKPRQALAGGALMAAQLSVTIAASSVVLRAGAISESIHSAIVLVVILLAVVAPVAFGKLMPPQAAQPQPILVAGANPLALRVAGRAKRHGPVVVIDSDPAKVAAAADSGFVVLQGDAADEAFLRQAMGAVTPRALAALTGNDEVNLATARLARTALKVEHVYPLVREAKLWEGARAEGLYAINPELASVALVENLLSSPRAADLVQSENEEIGLFDVVLKNPTLADKPLRAIRLPAGALVAAIHRANHKLIPHGDTTLAVGDVLTVVIPPEQVDAVRAYLGQ